VDRRPDTAGRGGQTTADAISAAGFRLFVDKGYPRVTAEAIARAAGISVRTFYRYFPEGKEGVILRYARSQVDDFVDAVSSRPPWESAFDALRNATLDVVSEWNSSAPRSPRHPLEVTVQVYAQIAAQDAILLARLVGERVLHLEPIVQQLALRLGVDPDLDPRPRLMTQAANAAVTAGWLTTRSDPESDWVDVVARSLDLLEVGLTSESADTASRRRRKTKKESA
jgi:AcrR family transcriptional regulator